MKTVTTRPSFQGDLMIRRIDTLPSGVKKRRKMASTSWPIPKLATITSSKAEPLTGLLVRRTRSLLISMWHRPPTSSICVRSIPTSRCTWNREFTKCGTRENIRRKVGAARRIE